MTKTFQESLQSSTLVFDGATGTELYRRNVFTNQCYDELNLRNRTMILQIAESYRNAGVDVLTTNTYGANRLSLELYGLESQVEAINRAGAEIVKEVANLDPERQIYVAGSVGYPSKSVLEKRTRDEIVGAYAEQVGFLANAGIDVVIFESQPSRESAEIMVDAVKEADVDVPFVVSYGLQESLFQEPNTLESRARHFSELFKPFDAGELAHIAWGLNCVLGPASMLGAVQEIVKTLELPLIVQPNAGAPQPFEGRLLYYSSPEYLSTYAMRYVDLGAAAVGGCCGTTPDEIAEVVKQVRPTSTSRRSTIVLVDAQPDVEEQEESRPETRSNLAQKLCSGQWVQTVEAIPPRGYDLGALIDKARTLKEAGVDAVNLPDGPRASARISSMVAAQKILVDAKIEPVLHICCRDRNLIGIQADLIGCAASGIANLLFITGDPPKLGNYPNATGVFDCDSIGLCQLQRRLNRGIDLGGLSIKDPTNAFFGVGFDPSAVNRERELERLHKKVESGAMFAVTQPVFGPDVLLKFLDDFGNLPIPVIAGVWPFVSYRNALFMRKEVPGVVVPDSVMAKMESAAKISKEAQVETGVSIARKLLEQIRSHVQGVQVSAPLGRIDVSLKVLDR
ncbi:MAG: bifunctional homocysteine S-methyltransferase/methylenetetrahydrofolate reductase [Thermoguttaceae bacterium]|jgi:methionine synthase I (cobalamin-dependent)/5,10-methylenetetrahydrofolate reductase